MLLNPKSLVTYLFACCRIDATASLRVIHQTGMDGNIAHGGQIVDEADKDVNHAMARASTGELYYDHGRTTDAAWATHRAPSTEEQITGNGQELPVSIFVASSVSFVHASFQRQLICWLYHLVT